MKRLYPRLFVAAFLCGTSLFAETSVYGGLLHNRGEHIFATGSRYPDIWGISGGSRLTFPRDVNFVNLGAVTESGPFQFDLRFTTTGWHVPAGNSRDEDFSLDLTSKEQGEKISLWNGTVRDTAYTYTGTKNWSDSIARSVMGGYSTRFTMRYAPGAEGYFTTFGADYSFYRHTVFDVLVLAIATNEIIPIDKAILYSDNAREVFVGGGRNWYFSEHFGAEIEAGLLMGDTNIRDYHIKRDINFLTYVVGPGFYYNFNLLHKFDSHRTLKFGYYGHRVFRRGKLRASGGNLGNFYYNFFPPQRAYANVKEAGLEMTFRQRM